MTTLATIATVGVRSPIGLNAIETALMLRAGSAAMAPCALADANGEPVTFCVQPTLDPRLIGPARAARLAIPAMEEALAPFGGLAGELSMKLVLCIDETFEAKVPVGAPHPAAEMVHWIHTRARELVAPKLPIQLCARGAAGPAQILEEQLDALGRGTHGAILLGGVHTDYDPARLAELVDKHRLYSPDNLDGLIPGETAAFVVLMRPDVARRMQIPPHASLVAYGSGWEDANPDNDHPAMEAKGLTYAVKQATKPLLDAGLQCGWSITDLTFEMRRMHEWQAMLIRTRKAWREPHVVDSPAQRIGHLGAAAMPLGMALAHEGWRRGMAPDGRCVGMAGSEAGGRGAWTLAAG
ncbi:MAG: hypothetical protein NVS3B10_19450 [Polyangiales bacterium]